MAQQAASDKYGPYSWLPHQRGATFVASSPLQRQAVATTVACAVLDASGLLGAGAALDTEPHGRDPSVREVAATSVDGRGALVKRLRAPDGVVSSAPPALGEEDYLEQHEGRNVTLKAGRGAWARARTRGGRGLCSWRAGAPWLARPQRLGHRSAARKSQTHQPPQAFRGLQGRAPYLYVVQFGSGDLKALSIREWEVNSLDLSRLPFADRHSLMVGRERPQQTAPPLLAHGLEAAQRAGPGPCAALLGRRGSTPRAGAPQTLPPGNHPPKPARRNSRMSSTWAGCRRTAS